jgi:hypothetical protein
MVNEFYIIGQEYTHMSYEDTWVCIDIGWTHAVFQSKETGTYLEVPHHKRHTWMYKKVSIRGQ